MLVCGFVLVSREGTWGWRLMALFSYITMTPSSGSKQAWGRGEGEGKAGVVS